MKLLNQENSAFIKTKFGHTDPVYLHGNLGQGSVLSVCQFSNKIDQLAKNLALQIIEQFRKEHILQLSSSNQK